MKMLDLSVQPPAQTRPGVALFPPVAARLSGQASMYNELSLIYAYVSLVHENGEPLPDQLSGKVADAAHPMPGMSGSGRHASNGHHVRDQAYFYFPDLVIHYPGLYRIRVTLMRMDYPYNSSNSGSIVEDYIESRSIVVDEGVSHYTRPSELSPLESIYVLICPGEKERAFLRMLRHDGQEVPSPS